VINFANTAAKELLKLEKLHYCIEKGFVFWIFVKVVLVLNFWKFVWIILVLL